MQSTEQEKPATVRIESKLGHAIDIPIPGPGKSYRGYVRIPGVAKDGTPGVVETDQLDSITLNRLRWHYGWRPTDSKLAGKPRHELQPDQMASIDLLKITILKDDKGGGDKKPQQTKAA